MNNYKHSYDWFLGSEIKQRCSAFMNNTTPNRILEIGCFEGLSSVFFADNFLAHPDSRLTCVDPFMTIQNNDHTQYLLNNEESNFDYNTSHCQNADKITIHKITSDQFFVKMNGSKTYNFIYIDGCHLPDFIERDMENSFRALEKNGIMWMDDYGGGDGVQIKRAMDSFLHRHDTEYEVVHTGYQLAIRKV